MFFLVYACMASDDSPKFRYTFAEQDSDPKAIVYWYLHGLRVRHTPPSVLSGLIATNGEGVLSWQREAAC